MSALDESTNLPSGGHLIMTLDQFRHDMADGALGLGLDGTQYVFDPSMLPVGARARDFSGGGMTWNGTTWMPDPI